MTDTVPDLLESIISSQLKALADIKQLVKELDQMAERQAKADGELQEYFDDMENGT